MNWKERRKIAHQQAYINRLFPSEPTDGVRVKNKEGKTEYLNQQPRTDWEKEFEIASDKVFKR